MNRRAFAIALVLAASSGHAAANEDLHVAALRGDVAAVGAWIAAGKPLDVTLDSPRGQLEGNYAVRDGLTPLMMAAATNQEQVVRRLVEAGAKTGLAAKCRVKSLCSDYVPFDYAIYYGHVSVARYLWSRTDRAVASRNLDEHRDLAHRNGRKAVLELLAEIAAR